MPQSHLMLDHPAGSAVNINAAILVSLDFGGGGYVENLEELRQLAASDGLAIPAVIKGRRSRPDPAYYAGSGKVDEIAAAVEQTGASLVIFNHNLSPAQQRNLEQRLQCRVLDRTNLILDIFAQRAKDRPNRLGVTTCRVLGVDGAVLRVSGLDAIDGTPLVDIKPHSPELDG